MTENLLSKDRRDVPPEPWWDDLDAAVLACLKAKGALAPHEVGREFASWSTRRYAPGRTPPNA